MGTRLQGEGNSILNAIEEGTVNAVITLWDSKLLKVTSNHSRRETIREILIHQFKLKRENVEYWLEWFHVD